MRIDDEHAYNQRINDIQTIHEHLLPEYRYKRLVTALARKHGTITGVYWLIDVVCALNPKEMPEERIIKLKQLTQKIYLAYDDCPSNKQMYALMNALGYGPTEIAEALEISRNTVYYFRKQNDELPTRCILTYGEYLLMLDFLDLWDEIKGMDLLGKTKQLF